MKKSLQSLLLLLAALMVPTTAVAAWVQVADGVYQDGSTLCIGSGVTSLGSLQLNPSVIYCYAAIPPACMSDTFTGYGATLHVPASAMVAYSSAQYWNNFANVLDDAVEPQAVTLYLTEAEMKWSKQLWLGGATVTPTGATPSTVYWSSTDIAIATVDASGMVSAVSPGECYIRAVCVDKQALCHVTVNPQYVTVTLDQQEARLLPNHLMKLKVTSPEPNYGFAVTSSDSAVVLARIANDVVQVYGFAEGAATITVSTLGDGWCYPAECHITVYTDYTKLGDVNCDDDVSISDATELIDYLLNGVAESISVKNADIDKNGNVNIGDVTALIDYLLSGRLPWGEEFTVNGVRFTMVTVEGGTFTMGGTAEQGNEAYTREYPTHQVALSSYCIGQTEVTQELWQAVMGSNPSYVKGNLQRPVDNVSWDDCQTFITKLNQMTGKQFRLPTEAEWEFAARGGTKSKGYKYSGSNDIDAVAWYWFNIPSEPAPYGTTGYGTQTVATMAPNELGLYDMSGNVWEWCQDWYGDYSSYAQTNPTGPASGSYRVIRGNGWYQTGSTGCRVSFRGSDNPRNKDLDLGLRLAL